MIDIHCHILPGLDDGPRTIDESVEMCRIAAADGIRTVVATPHFTPGMYEPSSTRVFELISLLQALLVQEGIDLAVLPGADLLVTPELTAHLKNNPHLSINRTGRYFLAEFAHDIVPAGWDSFLLSLITKGITPIVTHPERNSWFARNRDALVPFVERGGVVQITAMSVTGEFGDRAQDLSLYFLERNLAHLIASDAHSSSFRPPLLREAVSMAADIIGKERAEALVTSVPFAIIEGMPLPLAQPVAQKGKEKRWFQSLSL